MSPAKQYVSGTGTGTGNAPAKKSSVAQTCNQLSLFLKEKGCLKDLHFGFNSKFDDSVKSPTTKTIDLLSNMENFGQNTCDKPVAASESKTKQMTIFYNGQVIVVDEISEDRAKEVILAATTYSASATSKAAETCSSNEHLGSNQQIHVQLQANGLELPIARRASLHKFLAKRKDRANVRPEPYQLHNPSPASGSNKNEHKFDLNL